MPTLCSCCRERLRLSGTECQPGIQPWRIQGWRTSGHFRSRESPSLLVKIDTRNTLLRHPGCQLHCRRTAARGLDRLLLRGTEKTLGELNLMAITHNLLELHRAALNPA